MTVIPSNETLDRRIKALEAENLAIRATTVAKLDPKPGDIVLVRVGGVIQDGTEYSTTWIPNVAELECAVHDFSLVLPEGVKAMVYHFLLEPTVLSVEDADDLRIVPYDGTSIRAIESEPSRPD